MSLTAVTRSSEQKNLNFLKSVEFSQKIRKIRKRLRKSENISENPENFQIFSDFLKKKFVFRKKVITPQNFPGFKNPLDHSSYPTVQYLVRPMIRSYTRHVPILRTFFITEFLGARSSCLTCHKSENFPGKTFQGKLSRENFPGKTFQGTLYTEKGKWEKGAPKAFAGQAE